MHKLNGDDNYSCSSSKWLPIWKQVQLLVGQLLLLLFVVGINDG
jgi:hypothetical protein